MVPTFTLLASLLKSSQFTRIVTFQGKGITSYTLYFQGLVGTSYTIFQGLDRTSLPTFKAK